MDLVQCPDCGKQYQVTAQQAGKMARCTCGKSFPIPALALAAHDPPPLAIAEDTCPGCREPVLPNWKACPACGTRLAVAAATASPPSSLPDAGTASLVQAGDNSVVKAQINRNINVAGTGNSAPVGPAVAQPLIQSGEGSVIKAEVDASTNIHHDHSLKVQGQYVASQTVIHESSAGVIVRLLTGSFSNEDAREVEEQIKSLPDDPAQLQAILAQTLRHILREGKKRFKQQEGLFNFSDGMEGKGFRDRMAMTNSGGIDSVNRKRLDLCQKVLDKLHDSGHRSRDSHLLASIDRLDDSLINTEQLLHKLQLASMAKMFAMLGLMGIPMFFLMGFAEPGFLILGLFYGALAGGGIWFFQRFQKSVGERLTQVEATVSQLAEGRL